MPRMPLRTRAFTYLLDHLIYPNVADLDLDGIRRSRAQVAPNRPPFSWVTGPVPAHIRISDEWFPTRDGSRRQLRVYRPTGTGPHPVVIYYHGGGWVLNSTRLYDPLCAMIAARTSALVLSVDYRMAPEHRAPQAVHDAVDALRWAGESVGELHGDPSRIAVCGDSAGGNLAALVCHVAHDDGGPRIRHQALLYPGTDLSRSFPSILEHANAPVLTKRMVDVFVAHYLGPEPHLDPRDPTISPYWREDLRGLPPALVVTADIDPVRDEGLAYARRLAEAGVPTRSTNYLGATHGFFGYPGATLVGRQALLELVTELWRHLR
ncbi:MAG: lipase [Actinomycetales bacterium]|nr:MAG: lipase [Actinomycetales bacterium]